MGPGPMPNGTERARSTLQRVCAAPLGLPVKPTPHTFASGRGTRRRKALISDILLLQMSTLYSAEGASGRSWKLNRDAKGLKLWVPQSGRASKPHRLKVNEADRAKWAADIIDVAVDLLPQVLLDALRSAGEF